MILQVQNYLPDDLEHPFYAMTLSGAWSHRDGFHSGAWSLIEEKGDLVRAFGDLWKSPRDSQFSVMGAIEYAQVNM